MTATIENAKKSLKLLANLEQLRPMLEAAVQGKEIQVKTAMGTWMTVSGITFDGPADQYRIAPKKVKKALWVFSYEQDGILRVSSIQDCWGLVTEDEAERRLTHYRNAYQNVRLIEVPRTATMVEVG